MRYSCSGFTLFECVLVCALFALTIGLAMMNYSFLHAVVIRSELDKMHAACKYLQQCAQVTNRDYKLILDVEKQVYTVDGNVIALPSQMKFGFLSGALGPPSAPHKLLTYPITFNNNCITFTPHGIIQSGTVYIVDTAQQSMYALSCSVAQVSYIRKYRYNGTWCLIT